RSSGEFSRMVGDFERTGDQLTQITAAMEQLTASNGHVHESVTQVHALSNEVAGSMESSERSALLLSEATESVQELVSRFKIGRCSFDYNVERVRDLLDAVQKRLAGFESEGVNIWDQNYRPIANTNPQKFDVGYVSAFEREIQQLTEEALSRLKGGVYVL